MVTQDMKSVIIGIPKALKLVGIIGGVWAALVIVAAILAYLPEHPGFSIFTVYLSDIGDTPGWPQIFFNSGTLIAVPICYQVLVLLALRLNQLGAGRAFLIAALLIGFVTTSGTALMTATPFSVAPLVHQTGIGLYFLGVVALQSLLFFKEWSLNNVPKILPILSAAMVVFYLVFTTQMILYEQGVVTRTTPVIWEWLAILTSIIWMLAQSILLGKDEATGLLNGVD